MNSKCFNLNSKINLPIDISISCVQDKYLVVAPKKGTYIVLDSIQLELFKFLMKGHTLREIVNSRHFNTEYHPELQDLLIQFEVRKFYESYQPKQNKKLSARIYLTNDCNLKCIHCYRHSGKRESNELNLDDWKKILLELREYNIIDISFSGGEPFIFKGIYELIDYAVNIGMNVAVSSNGTKIDFRYTSTLKKLKRIQLSLDGPTEKINDDIRGKGVYCKVMETLDKLHSLEIPISIGMVLFEKYFDEYHQSLEIFLNKLENKYGRSLKIHFSTAILPGRNIHKDEISLFYNYSLQNFKDDVCKKIYGDRWIFQIYNDLFDLSFNTTCGYGTIMTIDPTGKVYACILPYYPIGNIHEDSISDIIFKLKKHKQNCNVDNLKPCSKCDVRYICGGGCRVIHRYLYNKKNYIKCEKRYVNELRRLLVEGYPYIYKGDVIEV